MIAWLPPQVGGSPSAARISAELATSRIPPWYRGQPQRCVVVSRMADNLLVSEIGRNKQIRQHGPVLQIAQQIDDRDIEGLDTGSSCARMLNYSPWVAPYGSLTDRPSAFTHRRRAFNHEARSRSAPGRSSQSRKGAGSGSRQHNNIGRVHRVLAIQVGGADNFPMVVAVSCVDVGFPSSAPRSGMAARRISACSTALLRQPESLSNRPMHAVRLPPNPAHTTSRGPSPRTSVPTTLPVWSSAAIVETSDDTVDRDEPRSDISQPRR
jgi:hypothetical protein